MLDTLGYRASILDIRRLHVIGTSRLWPLPLPLIIQKQGHPIKGKTNVVFFPKDDLNQLYVCAIPVLFRVLLLEVSSTI